MSSMTEPDVYTGDGTMRDQINPLSLRLLQKKKKKPNQHQKASAAGRIKAKVSVTEKLSAF